MTIVHYNYGAVNLAFIVDDNIMLAHLAQFGVYVVQVMYEDQQLPSGMCSVAKRHLFCCCLIQVYKTASCVCAIGRCDVALRCLPLPHSMLRPLCLL